MALRSQAELISTVIIVGIAVALALAIVNFLIPLVSQTRVTQLIYSTAAEASSSLSASIVSVVNDTASINASVILSNVGTGGAYAVYASVLAFDNTTGLPVAPVNATFYVLNATAAPLSGDTGWLLLTNYGLNGTEVYLYVKGDYYRVDRISPVAWVNMSSLGIVEAGRSRVYKVYITDPGVCYNNVCAVTFYVMINGKYYEVLRLPLVFG